MDPAARRVRRLGTPPPRPPSRAGAPRRHRRSQAALACSDPDRRRRSQWRAPRAVAAAWRNGSARAGPEATLRRAWASCSACLAAAAHVEGLVDKQTHYPPHAEELLEAPAPPQPAARVPRAALPPRGGTTDLSARPRQEHFFRFWASNAHRFPSEVRALRPRARVAPARALTMTPPPFSCRARLSMCR
jgi:hypothetical protein